jgi:hypothetical protein
MTGGGGEMAAAPGTSAHRPLARLLRAAVAQTGLHANREPQHRYYPACTVTQC